MRYPPTSKAEFHTDKLTWEESYSFYTRDSLIQDYAKNSRLNGDFLKMLN